MFPVYLSRRCCKMQITYIVHFMFKLVWMENFADRLHRVFLVCFLNFVSAKDPTDSLHQIGLHDFFSWELIWLEELCKHTASKYLHGVLLLLPVCFSKRSGRHTSKKQPCIFVAKLSPWKKCRSTASNDLAFFSKTKIGSNSPKLKLCFHQFLIFRFAIFHF